MSRTAHHTPFAHWRRQERDIFPDGVRYGYPWPVEHVVFDLRFYAGCRRVPAAVRARVEFGGYLHGHGGTDTVTVRAREIEGGLRDARRAFARTALKAHRAGGDLEGLLEPDGRTRHQALWDAT